MDGVPVVSTRGKTNPMAVAPDLGRGVMEKEIAARPTLFDIALKRSVRSLIRSRVIGAVVPPAALLPIRNLAALYGNSGAVPPHHPRDRVADGNGSRPGAEFSYAHTVMPTSAFVELKIFSPSFTLS